MGRGKILLRSDTLKHLYLNKNLTPLQIGKKLKCSFKTVRNRLQEYGIPLKNPALARMRYKKFDCNANSETKAYMVGFRVGDLNVYKRGVTSETVVVRCHTTQKVQVAVIKSLFCSFGRVSISRRGEHFTINCFLNRTFEFLIPKDTSALEWVKDDDTLLASFVAGYVDAEANFIINQGKARFKIDSYDCSVLEMIFFWMSRCGIDAKYRCIRRKGPSWAKQPPLNEDLWRLNVNIADSLEKFVNIILPFMRHRDRIQGARKCLKNIHTRRNNGSIK